MNARDEQLLRDAVVAEIHNITRSLIHCEMGVELVEDGLVYETPNFVLKISIERGTCEECELYPPMFDADICEECNEDRVDMQKAIDFTE